LNIDPVKDKRAERADYMISLRKQKKQELFRQKRWKYLEEQYKKGEENSQQK